MNNILMYGMPSYIIKYRIYKLLHVVLFFAPPGTFRMIVDM